MSMLSPRRSPRLALRATALLALSHVLAAGCATSPAASKSPGSAPAPAGATATVSTSMGAPGAWRPLFDGHSLAGWRGYKSDSAPQGWHAVNGELTKSGPTEDLISRDEFGDFELAFDWKLAQGGNAGVFYHANEEYDHIYWSGPEYQLLDDAHHPDGHNRLTSAGAAYGLYAPPAGVVKPAEEWNSSRIVVRGAHVEHWLNGQKVVEYELWSPDWEARVLASKFHEYPNYGRAHRGHIGLQGDHDGALAMRDIRIREL